MTATIPIAKAASPPKGSTASLTPPLPVGVAAAAEPVVELSVELFFEELAEVTMDEPEAAVDEAPSMTVVVW
jgi:hypothetical protein